VAGGNDVLRFRGTVDQMAARLDWAVAKARATGADVLLSTCGDPADSPWIKLTRGRAAQFYMLQWSIARRHGARVIDMWGLPAARDLRFFAPDRIHLTSEGHRRVANAALVALGLEPDDPDFAKPLPPAPPSALAQQARADAGWFSEHAVPWMSRRLGHRSSGDGRSAKRPDPTPMPPARALPD
jgi:hypothetical protein